MDASKVKQVKKEIDDILGDVEQELLKDILEELSVQNVKFVRLIKLIEKADITKKQKIWFKTLIKAIRQMKLELPEKLDVFVQNFPSYPKFPKEIKITNLPKYPKEIRVSNFPKHQVFPRVINVGNLKDITFPKTVNVEKPDWLRQLNEKDIAIAFLKALEKISKKDGLKVDLDKYRDASKALAVRLSDGRAFYNALIAAMSSGIAFPFKDTDDKVKEALVDKDGHLQIDVLSIVNIEYVTNAIDDYTITDVTYFGKEDKDGNWWIMKIDETGNYSVFSHATKTNNGGVTTYSSAWTNRTTLVYGDYSEAF